MTSEQSKEYTFHFLHEEVAEQDLYEDKTHENVAETMHRFIQANKDRGMTIGVEGSWGAGKSTVIHLLKKKIDSGCESESDKKSLFFLFDAWAHEGDPLRRVFLESLIDEVSKKTESSQFDEIKAKLKGEVKEQIKTEHSTTPYAFWLSVSAFLIPLGIAILKNTEYAMPWESNKKDALNLTACLGFLLAVAPILLICVHALITVVNLSKKKKKGRDFWEGLKGGFALISGKRKIDYTSVISTNSDKTSLEFEEYFNQILECALDAKGDYCYDKAIIIIDNLDRVDASDALKIWSNLQTFFQHRNGHLKDDESWKKNIWFVVPHDREAIQKLWKSNTDGENDIKAITPCAFLDKCFQVRFEVPEPVLSAWHGYLKDQVNVAFKEWQLKEREEVTLAFERCHSKLSKSPKPREIRNFINQVGALKMQWGSKVRTEIIAIYVCLRHQYSSSQLREALLEGEKIDTIEVSGSTDNLAKDIAGLLFGVSADKGIQILLEPEIRRAVIGDGNITLGALIKKHQAAFWIVWRAIYEELLLDNRDAGHAALIQATQRIGEIFSEYSEELIPTQRHIIRHWQNLAQQSWVGENGLEDDYATGLEHLEIIAGTDKWLWPHLATRLKNDLEGVVQYVLNNPSVKEEQLSQTDKISKLLARVNEPVTGQKLSILSGVQWDNWARILDDYSIEPGLIVPNDGDINSYADAFPSHRNQQLPPQRINGLMRAVIDAPDSSEWGTVVSSINQWMRSSTRHPNQNQLVYKLCTKMIESLSSAVLAPLKNSIKNQQFWQIANSHTMEPDLDLFLLALFAYEGSVLTDCPSQHVQNYWSKKLDEDGLLRLKQRVVDLGLERWILILAKNAQPSLAHSLLFNGLDDSEFFAEPLTHDLLPALHKWTEDGSEGYELNKFSTAVCVHYDLKSYQNIILEDASSWAETLFYLAECEHESGRELVASVVKSLSEESWKSAFKNCSHFLDCALYDWVNLDHRYSDAFLEYIKEQIQNKCDADDWTWESFDELHKATQRSEKLAEEISQYYFCNTEDLLTDLAFESLSHLFLDNLDNISIGNLHDRVSMWIKNGQIDRIKWINNSGVSHEGVAPADLLTRVQEWIDSGKDEKTEVAKKIADQFNLDNQLKSIVEPKEAEE